MKPRLIVVEDNLIIAMDLLAILKQEGYQIISHVVSVEQAILAIEESQPNLVLIDINLKNGRDGISLGHYLMKKGGIPYVYISSYSDRFTIERVKETLPYGFIGKPYKKTDITTTVSLVLNHFKHANTNLAETISSMNIEAIPFILKDIVAYISDNVNEKMTVSDLSLRSRWKKQHFIRVFTSYIGETPYQFILIKKIEKAKNMITETSIPVIEIGFELGFLSYGNFCNAFKKIAQKTPNEYRKMYGKAYPTEQQHSWQD